MHLISRFPEGIDIYIDGSTEDCPAMHVHARAAEGESLFSIPDAEYIRGEASRDTVIDVEAWFVAFEDDARLAWNDAAAGCAPGPIDVLV